VIELVVLACLLAEPKHCEEFHVPFVQPMAAECLARPAAFEVIQWANQHPLWIIKRWTCGPPRA
jgi:hypothetical protein